MTVKYVRRCSRICIFLMAACLFLLSACKQVNLRALLDHDKTPPGTVSNVRVKNLNGGAKITYSLPADSDLLRVVADYEIRPGVKEQSSCSLYGNSVTVEGFGDTSEHEVSLYAMDRSGNKSAPVAVTVKPLISPVQQVFDSLSYIANFGGILVGFQNETSANIVITVSIKDSTGAWVDYDKDYTSQRQGPFIVSGLPDKSTTFGVFVQDRWGNYSDTLIKTLTPLLEVELDKTKFREVILNGDAADAWNFTAMWDGNTTSGDGFATVVTTKFPQSLTIDLGVKAKLSRFRTWGIQGGREYGSANIKAFQVWGSNNPDPDGSWGSWTLLGNFEVIKPSGLPTSQLSDEDVATAAAGDQQRVPIDAPAVRYLRFKVLSSFSASSIGGIWLTEVSFWGQIQP